MPTPAEIAAVRFTYTVEAMDAAEPTGPHRCCSPRCPGRPYKASDYRHPAPCTADLEAPVRQPKRRAGR